MIKLFNYNYQDYLNPSYSRQKVIRVNGENGARAYQMPPESEAILLDETAPLIWLVLTDGAGYKTVTPYTIEPYVPKTVDLDNLVTRLERLEEVLNEQQSNITNSSTEQTSVKSTIPDGQVSAVRKGKSRANA